MICVEDVKVEEEGNLVTTTVKAKLDDGKIIVMKDSFEVNKEEDKGNS